MAEDTETMSVGVGCDTPAPTNEESPATEEPKTECEAVATSDVSCQIHENGVVLETEDAKVKRTMIAQEPGAPSEDALTTLGELSSLAAGEELAAAAAGSDSGVEGCGGRALSSGGGERSCASSVVSCGSGCGSESSSVAGAPPRPRRRLTVTVAEPHKRAAPVPACTPRPVTAPRGPNLATRERARSREKPTVPEKPRPLTPKPRTRPTGELPSLVRESPALRAKPTKTSAARCRTPSSPSEEKRWPAAGAVRQAGAADASATRLAADRYGTLPRRRRDPDADGSPRHELTPPSSRRATVARSASSRTTKTRVRIYAEKTSQTVLLGSDVEAALAGLTPNIESRIEVSKCSRGVQANARESETARLSAALARLEAQLAEERARRARVEEQLAEERGARRAASKQLETNSLRLLELAGAGAEAGADACLRALDSQLRAAGELSARQRQELEALRAACDKMHAESCQSREAARLAEARRAEAEREAAEMQDFLAAETGALQDSLRDSDASLTRATADLDRSRAECRQLVRMCEQRRQEALSAAARARRAGGAAAALDALARRLRAITAAVARAYCLPEDKLEPTVYHNDVYSRSDSGSALSPESESGGGLLAAVARALRSPAPARDDDSDDHDDHDADNSADLLDSETEPCLVTDPECAEEWWSGAEGADGWSGSELSPARGSPPPAPAPGSPLSERESLRQLSAAIAQRHRSEAEDSRGSLLERALAVDARLSELLRALRLAAAAAARADDKDAMRLANALRDKMSVTERSVAEVVVKKLAELEARGALLQHYRADLQMIKKQLTHSGEEESLELLEEELVGCSEAERRERYEALDAALSALAARPGALRGWRRLADHHAALERLAFALAAPPPPPPRQPPQPEMLHTTA